jgi:mannose-6-phosphate isomerase-like protein (cupin superfamily)
MGDGRKETIHAIDEAGGEGKARDFRPWGYYEVLADLSDCKVKRIVVYPGCRLSLQRHKHRDEHWFVLAGDALVTIGRREIPVAKNGSVDIPRAFLHRVNNTGSGDFVFIEVQTGDYFGEDDIERLEDDYGRA